MYFFKCARRDIPGRPFSVGNLISFVKVIIKEHMLSIDDFFLISAGHFLMGDFSLFVVVASETGVNALLTVS